MKSLSYVFLTKRIFVDRSFTFILLNK
uniref:Uncharacterized protein n=1 Tax=Wuchereria bancrofti TaxID=6293 RepID=A0AAF5Q451_WUCBA